MCFPPFRQEALLAAISEKDANIALLELSSSKKKTQEEVAALKREKDRLVQQLKQQVLGVPKDSTGRQSSALSDMSAISKMFLVPCVSC